MTEVDVYFANGQEALSAYWGHLSGGGLAIVGGNDDALHEGEHIALRVHIGSLPVLALSGRVLRCAAGRTVVAFDSKDSQNRLFTAALSERDINIEAYLRVIAPEKKTIAARALVFELGAEGCCLRLDPMVWSQLDVGIEVELEAGEFRAAGCIVSAFDCECCVLFASDNDSPMASCNHQTLAMAGAV